MGMQHGMHTHTSVGMQQFMVGNQHVMLQYRQCLQAAGACVSLTGTMSVVVLHEAALEAAHELRMLLECTIMLHLLMQMYCSVSLTLYVV